MEMHASVARRPLLFSTSLAPFGGQRGSFVYGVAVLRPDADQHGSGGFSQTELSEAFSQCLIRENPPDPRSSASHESEGSGALKRKRAFDLQGHRGARGLRPENTLPSFEAAFDAGVSTVETDIHLTADGVAVIFHDDTLSERLCRR